MICIDCKRNQAEKSDVLCKDCLLKNKAIEKAEEKENTVSSKKVGRVHDVGRSLRDYHGGYNE
jgi:NMD protein affecting ribosome stability and mRNA decay